MIQNDLNIDKFIYGGDYNPEQWLDRPDILKQDLLLMKKAHINTVTMGVFSWSTLEPIKDCFNFTWLIDIIDKLYDNGIQVILATPSGARPRWLAETYPEVLRVCQYLYICFLTSCEKLLDIMDNGIHLCIHWKYATGLLPDDFEMF